MSPDTQRRPAATTSTPRTILLVESDGLVRSPLAAYLRECGYRVLEAVDAAEARALVAAEPELLDLVFAAVGLRGEQNGFSLARWVRQMQPGLEVLLAGSAPQAVSKAGALCEDGPNPVKPPGHEAVLRRIQQALARAGRI